MRDDGRLRLLIVGGYGTFGGRLVRLLADESRLTMIVAGRSAAKAVAFCATVPSRATLCPAAFDRDGDLPKHLNALAPDLVIDASGPFQVLGPAPYRLVEACLEQGIDYADLADGSAFVRGIDRFDANARQRGTFVLSGLSTFPALTFAVVRRLTEGLGGIERITAVVAPSPSAVVGLSVIRAIASYAGRRIPLYRGGMPATGFALVESRRMTIAPPGCVPLFSRLFSLVDVPDLTLAEAAFRGLETVWVGAGTRPALPHYGLIALAWLVRMGLMPDLNRFAGVFHRARRTLRWGEDRGGLMIEVEGLATSGERVSKSWHLIAEGESGPFIPCFPAAALVRFILDGKVIACGARPATDALQLPDFLPLFENHRIRVGCREESAATRIRPLYQAMLGESWDALPPRVQALHGMPDSTKFTGVAQVVRGGGLLAKLLAVLIGFPQTGTDIPVAVRFERRDGGEVWHRDFAGRRFSSVQTPGRGRWRHLVVERFGPVAVGLGLAVEDRRLRLVVRRWSVLGLPLPLGLAPGGNTYESEIDGRFAFHVEIATPFTGLVVRYVGWLSPAP